MSNSTPAVFISYASQDAESAKRLCEALRAAGIEVWFDQNELVGGDAWDAKIRGQIGSCALFVPVISAATQARREGYFRLEWKLAAQRTHMMSERAPFLLPVVIDATRDAEADVPGEFRAVQWTRLPGGEVPPAFVQRVRSLLGAGAAGAADPGLPATAEPASARPATTTAKSVRRITATGWFAMVASIVLITALFIARKPAPTAASPSAAAQPPVDLAAAKSIAVLPFENLSAAADSADFTDGMHEEILTAVGKVAALKVIGRTSVLPYADAKKRNLRQIASTLGVVNVVEGSVRRLGNRVKIAVQLVETQSSRQLWAETYERELIDVFAIQSAIAHEVAARLNATLTTDERALLERRPTRNVQAYELFLRAQQIWNGLLSVSPVEQWEQAVRLLGEAVKADPEFAPAHTLLARIHAIMYWFPSIDASPTRFELARQSLANLRRVAPSAPETEYSEGNFAFFCERQWAEALRHYDRALVHLPNNTDLIRNTGFVKFNLERYAEGIATTTRAYELNPLEMQSAVDLALMLSMLRRFPAVVALGDRVAGFSPDPPNSFRRFVEFARFELSGDRDQLSRRLRDFPLYDPSGLFAAYESAMIEGDLMAASRHLADPRLNDFNHRIGAGVGPVALHRAYVARLLDQREVAAAEAISATTLLRSQDPSPRVRLYVATQLARAAACGGREDEARKLAAQLQQGLVGVGALDRANCLNELGRIYALIGAREEALACLRTLMTGPSGGPMTGYSFPNCIRIDPCWSRLADDSRFEEILKAAKPL